MLPSWKNLGLVNYEGVFFTHHSQAKVSFYKSYLQLDTLQRLAAAFPATVLQGRALSTAKKYFEAYRMLENMGIQTQTPRF